MNISALLIATLFLAQVEGYVQTPIGGRPGSSSLLRPQLTELGIQEIPIVDNLLVVGNKYLGYQQIRAEGTKVLKDPLKTYGKPIPASTSVKSGIKFDWYRFGTTYPLSILSFWQITPAIEFIIFDFGYRFKTPRIQSGRTYRQMGVRIGFTVQEGTVIRSRFVSIPGLGRVQISTDSVGTNTAGRQSLQIFFKDSQPLPNQLLLQATGKFTRQAVHNIPAAIPISPLLLNKKSLNW